MGWTYISVKPWHTIEDIKAQHVRDISWTTDGAKAELIAHEWKPKTFFAIVKFTNSEGKAETVLCVDMIDTRGKTFGYKDMSEEMGPYNENKPSRAFAKLIYEHIPVAKGCARDWRDRNGVKYETM